MNPLKPYIIRAINDWIVDNNDTPHILVNASYPDTLVPQEYIKHGKIVLNISPTAVENLTISDTEIVFDAKFSGNDSHIIVPIPAILSIYSKEHGKGMIFDSTSDPETPPPPKENKSKPQLRIVK